MVSKVKIIGALAFLSSAIALTSKYRSTKEADAGADQKVFPVYHPDISI